MKPLYTQEQFKNNKTEDKLPCECYTCKNIFFIKKKQIVAHLRGSKDKCMYCSKKCVQPYRPVKQTVNCKTCNKDFLKHPNQIKKTKNNFCSKSCAGSYNSTHKLTGTRRSKLEVYLEQQLTSLYQNLLIDFNKKNTINSELDIYIPSLKLAFELNGIFHYEPIHGPDKLNQIQK